MTLLKKSKRSVVVLDYMFIIFCFVAMVSGSRIGGWLVVSDYLFIVLV